METLYTLPYPVNCRIIGTWYFKAKVNIMNKSAQKNLYSSEKEERLEARLSQQQKTLIQRAADLVGRSLTDFVISSSQQAANKVIREHEIITLTSQESKRFVNTILNPTKPNAALKKAAKKYSAFINTTNL